MGEKRMKTCCILMDIELEYDIDTLIKIFNEYKEKYSNQYESLRLERDFSYDEYRYSLYGSRLETDEEYEERINHEQRSKEIQEKTDRMTYERLKARFGV